MESILDIVINPKGVIEGVAVVKTHLKQLGDSAGNAVDKINEKFHSMRSALFSVQAAMASIGFGLAVKDMVDFALGLERAERSLRAVTVSAMAARQQLENIRKIGDEFMIFEDQSLVNAFRLLASNGVKDTENALRTVANAAAGTGVEVETVTLAILSGMERPLRQLGVTTTDLGNQMAYTFGNVTVYADKTDSSIRNGLLRLFKQVMPDAAKEMQNSLEYNFKVVKDRWEDLQIAIMRGGVQQAITGVFKSIGDAFSEEDVEAIGKKMADGIVRGLRAITVGTAFLIDTLTPIARILFEIVERAARVFNSLPTEIQAVGLLGFIMMGTDGRIALIGTMALMDLLGLKMDEIIEKTGKVSKVSVNMAAQSPIGMMTQKFTQWWTGVKPPMAETPLGGQAPELPSPFDSGKSIAKWLNLAGGKDTEDSVKAFWDKVEGEIKKATDAARKYNEEITKAGGKDQMLKQTEFNESRARAKAALDMLREQVTMTSELEKSRISKDTGLPRGSILMDQDKKRADFLIKLQEKKIELLPTELAQLNQILDAETKIKLENQRIILEQERRQKLSEAFYNLQQKTSDAVRDVKDKIELMNVPLGFARRTEEIRLGITRELQKVGGGLSDAERQRYQMLLAQAGVLAQQERRLAQLGLIEKNRIDDAESLIRLEQKIRDARGGRSTPSLGSRVENRVRPLELAGGTLSPEELEMETLREFNRMQLERTAAIEDQSLAIKRETDNLRELNTVVGMTRSEREMETRVIQEKQRLQMEGKDLNENELDHMRKLQSGLQQQKNLARQQNAINNFFNSMEVGWDQVGQTATTVSNRMVDSLTEFAMTGKTSMADFVKFAEAELMRLLIRALMFQAISGIASFFGGPAVGAAAGAGNLSNVMTLANSRNVSNVNVKGLTFAEGGAANFGEESLVKLHGEEAIVPLSRGRSIPVTLRNPGGRELSTTRSERSMMVSMPVAIYNNASHDTKVETRQSQSSTGGPQLEIVVSKLLDKAMTQGRMDKTMRSRYGLTPGERVQR